MTQRLLGTGFLVAADVTGYTEFLTASELDHAHDLMRGLMAALSRSLTAPIQIVKYEGDAVLCYAPDGAVGTTLMLDILEQVYVAFADHLYNMQTCTSCSCRACANLRTLDLKLFLHHGRFVLEDHGRGPDLSGPDVILLHRLMKNRVRESTGIAAFMLATQAALDRLGHPRGFRAHQETYEHFGEVACGVSDLRESLEQRRAAREVRVAPSDAAVVCEAIVAGPPPMVWDHFFDARKRIAWDGTVTSVRAARDGRGREGPGAAMHCAHGSFTSVGTTLDWKPFCYFTQQYLSDGSGFFLPPLTMTVETEPLSGGDTRVRQLVRVAGANPLHHLVVRLLRRSLERRGNRNLARLGAAIRGNAAALGSDG